jgi:hypothetical protein
MLNVSEECFQNGTYESANYIAVSD